MNRLARLLKSALYLLGLITLSILCAAIGAVAGVAAGVGLAVVVVKERRR